MDWKPISSAPKDGSKFFAAAPDYEWPEVIYWEKYPAEVQEEAGDEGFWRYAEQLLADVADVEMEALTHWMPLPLPPELLP